VPGELVTMTSSQIDPMGADRRGARGAASDAGGLMLDLAIKERRLVAIESLVVEPR